MHVERQRPRTVTTVLKRKDKAGGPMPPSLKTECTAAVMKTARTGDRTDRQISGTEYRAQKQTHTNILN